MTRHISLATLAILCACTTGGFPDDGGQSGEESIVCTDVDSLALAADEASALGFGRTEVAALAEGAHSGTLGYAAGGSAGLTLEVTLGDARWLDMEMVDDGADGGPEPAMMDCVDVVEVDAEIAFSSDDGAFAETWTTALRAPSADYAEWTVDLDLDALAGSFTYTPDAAYEEINAWVDGWFDADGSHGEIEGQGTQTEGSGDDGTVSATSLPMASW